MRAQFRSPGIRVCQVRPKKWINGWVDGQKDNRRAGWMDDWMMQIPNRERHQGTVSCWSRSSQVWSSID
jgi:hypothetical protein